MMSLRVSLIGPLLSLIFISGAAAQDGWGVTYYPNSICALKGSAVKMVCSYRFPGGHSVQNNYWSKTLSEDVKPPNLLDDPEYSNRIENFMDKESDCTIKLKDVREEDQRKYYFRFLTNKGGMYLGRDGVDLSVTGLQVEGPANVTEGNKVNLTCKTTCRLTDTPTFTWFRDGSPLSSSYTDQLHLWPVSREDAGRYRCAVGQNLQSPEVILNVENKSSVVGMVVGVIVAVVGAVVVFGVIGFVLRKRKSSFRQRMDRLSSTDHNKPANVNKELLPDPNDSGP